MKRTPRIILILLLMLATALTIAFIVITNWFAPGMKGADAKNGISVESKENEEDPDHNQKLILPEGDVVLQVGQSRQCSVVFEDGSPAKNVFWSSSDEKIARVDNTGRITAVAAGQTKLLAVVNKDVKTFVSVSVFEDIRTAAEDAVNALATDGSVESMQRVDSIAISLSHATDGGSADTAAVLKALSGFKAAGAKGSSDAPKLWNTLTQAAAASEMQFDEKTLRQAALAAYSHGEKESADLTLTFTGDCTFGYFNELDTAARFPYIYEHSGSVTYPFDLTRQVFAADDITMINFEGTLTESTKHKRKQFYFRGKPEYVNILPSSSVEAVTVENNHSYDYYDTGYNDTVDTLKKAGIFCTSRYDPAVIDVRDYRVVMLSLCLIDINFSDEYREQLENYIARYKNNSTVIVMNLHWGIEMAGVPQKSQIKAAHEMIDAGVDLVIGNHPHVPQGIERYNGHYIFYSLGNFSFGGNAKAKRPDTFMVRAMFGRDGDGKAVLKRFSVIPCLTTSSGSVVNNYRPTPLYGKRGQQLIDRLISLSSHLNGGVDRLTWNQIP